MPFLSIVIPAYDREHLIGRAIESALSQSFQDFEVIVVDDTSRDRTREVVGEYVARDPRVRLICHEVNRGVCPTRNTGVDAARAPWVVFLDSDDELAPEALSIMAARARAAEPDVALLRFSCLWDDGSISPYPLLTDELWDFAGYIGFQHRSSGYSAETIMCVRRETFEIVRWPENRSFEGGYHLDFARLYRTRAYGDVARLYHADAGNSSTFDPDPKYWLRRAPDLARGMVDILERYGDSLREHGPNVYRDVLRSAMKYSFLAGDRRSGFRYGCRALAGSPLAPRIWVVLLAGLIHPMLLARIDAATMQMRLPEMPVKRETT